MNLSIAGAARAASRCSRARTDTWTPLSATLVCVPVRTEPKPDGIRYIATATGKTYRSLNYHRSAGRDKSIWTVPRGDEFALFCRADNNGWADHKGYWSFKGDAREIIGQRRERPARIAFFPHKAAGAEDWHGYPLPLTPVQRPSVELIASWVAADHISFAAGEKIKRGRR
jgi:hypothetical protein